MKRRFHRHVIPHLPVKPTVLSVGMPEIVVMLARQSKDSSRRFVLTFLSPFFKWLAPLGVGRLELKQAVEFALKCARVHLYRAIGEVGPAAADLAGTLQELLVDGRGEGRLSVAERYWQWLRRF